MKFSIIIPAHNEEGNIEQVIRRLEEAVHLEYEIVVVDDHSNDSTAEIVRRLALEYPNINLVSNHRDAGFANALKTGFEKTRSEIVVPVMADLCDDPNTINRMHEKAKEGFDIVCGSRYMKGGRKIGGPRLKSFFSRFVGISLHLITGIPMHDISNSFKLYRKKVIESIDIESSGFEISAEIPLKAYFLGYKITEIPTTWMNRKEGESKFEIIKHGSRYLKLYLWALWKKISKI